MVYEIQQCFAFLVTCFEKMDWYSKNDGTFNPSSPQIYLFDDWMNKSTRATNAYQDSSEDVPHQKKQATLQIQGPMGQGKLALGPICSSQAGPASATKNKAPTKRKYPVKKETDTKENRSRTVGTPTKAFEHSDN